LEVVDIPIEKEIIVNYMIKFFVILFCFIGLNASAQNNDYVILNSGDTLRGRIKRFEDITDIKRFQKVHFFKDEQKVEFEPDEIKGYRMGKDVYVTWDVGRKKPNLVFFYVMQKGHCTLYESKVYYGIGVDGFGRAYSNVSYTLYLHREGEELHPVIFPYLKQGKDLYFIDNVALTYDIKTGKYRRTELPNIVFRYNKEWEEKQKEQN
jgi:hypothetical protein